MSKGKYDEKCQACQFIVYATPLVALLILGMGIYWKLNQLELWLAYSLTALVSYPLLLWLGKRMPMLHEYLKEDV